MTIRTGATSSNGAPRRSARRSSTDALGDEPLKVGYIYLGPIGDYGWTWAHEKGRKEMVAPRMGGKVTADYVENVNEDASATPVISDLAKSGPQADLHDVVRLHGPDARGGQGISGHRNSSIAPATSTPKTSAPTTTASMKRAR